MILVTGVDGYLGWPVFLRLLKRYPKELIVGVDNFGRRDWVNECGCVSAIPIESVKNRMGKIPNEAIFDWTTLDLTDKYRTYGFLETWKPNVILHLAAQPSAPYSQIDGDHARFTQFNNNEATRNLLWGMKELGLKDTHFIMTTTTGVYGTPNFEIPEGFFEIEYKGCKDKVPAPHMAGSWYHMSKCTDVNNMYLANKLWGFSITDLRTAIIYGTNIEETRLEGLATRFDFDYWFGVVNNRFCAQALAGYPITIYGKGLQQKPMISLEDAVESTVRAVKLENKGEYKVINQVTETVSIVNLATSIQLAADKLGFIVEIKHVPNPRVEKEMQHMRIANDGLKKLLKQNVFKGVRANMKEMLEDLILYKDRIIQYRDKFLPAELLKEEK